MEYSLRNSTYDDVDFILELKRLGLKCYIEKIYGWDEEVQRNKTLKELDANINAFKIIVVEGVDVGVTGFCKNNDCYYIGLTLIHPDYQNKGIATNILEGYIDIARKENKRIVIKTYKENRAKKLYERLGFIEYKKDDTHVYLEINFNHKE